MIPPPLRLWFQCFSSKCIICFLVIPYAQQHLVVPLKMKFLCVTSTLCSLFIRSLTIIMYEAKHSCQCFLFVFQNWITLILFLFFGIEFILNTNIISEWNCRIGACFHQQSIEYWDFIPIEWDAIRTRTPRYNQQTTNTLRTVQKLSMIKHLLSSASNIWFDSIGLASIKRSHSTVLPRLLNVMRKFLKSRW